MVSERIDFHGLSCLGKSTRFCQKILFLSLVIIQFITLDLVLCFYILMCEIFISPNVSKQVLVIYIFNGVYAENRIVLVQNCKYLTEGRILALTF